MKEETISKILAFRDEREWQQYHNGKDLAISLALEASELLEVFQWSGKDLDVKNKVEQIKEELADILMYGVLLADVYKLDIDKIITDKITNNGLKYPVALSKGKSTKYTELNNE